MYRVIDGFLDDFEGFRRHCDALDYRGTVNPVDGVLYPGISIDVPVAGEVAQKLGVDPGTVFLRLTREGDSVPHQAHNDATMGRIGVIVYMNRPEHCAGGTSVVRHVDEGMELGPQDARQEAIWQRDTNRPEQWEILHMVDMAPNRAFVFDTRVMHRAEPPAGFGSTAADGRLVLVGFFP